MKAEHQRLPRALLAPRHWPTWLGLGLLWALTQCPTAWRHALGRAIGRLAWHVNRKRREVTLVNLRLCFPHWDEARREAVGRAHFAAMGRSLLDYGLIWFASDRRLLDHLLVEGWEHVEAARAAGRNIILHGAHSPGLDFGVTAIGARAPGVGPYHALKNPVVDWFMLRGRRRFGGELFERGDGMLAYTRALRQGKLLVIFADEDYGPERSVFAPFFGQPKATLPMLARLARLADAAVLPFMTGWDAASDRYLTRIAPPLAGFPSGDAARDAAALNAGLEALIDDWPAEYLWTLKLFRTRPDGGRVYP